MNRRNFIKTSGLSLGAVLLYNPLLNSFGSQKNHVIKLPDEVYAMVNNNIEKLEGVKKNVVGSLNVTVFIEQSDEEITVYIEAPKSSLSGLRLSWNLPFKKSSIFLNDHWERAYGDLSWHNQIQNEILPWYFLEHNGKDTNGFGVKTGGNAFCYWQIFDGKLHLNIDTRSGGIGVQLLSRRLKAAEIVTIKSKPDESAFETGRRFTKMMCDSPRLPEEPVYGINDWYFSYGDTSADLIIEHTKLIAPLADGIYNRPFSIVDSGWFVGPPDSPDDCCFGDMKRPDENFKDMSSLADKIKKLNIRPGIWTRPLCANENDPIPTLLPNVNGRSSNRPMLDPSIPENLERIKDIMNLYNEWGYEIIKFDYTSLDYFGKFGTEMINQHSVVNSGWSVYDVNKTNAEIILNLYKAIREAAGKTYIIGCNTFSHLSAGLFELNRIGDDTSGQNWERTKMMGVNSLAFRGIQHNHFYSADADCVGLTDKIPWTKNKQWMKLLAYSGTPLFISAQPNAVGTEQKEFIKQCFGVASQNLPLGEPLDWFESKTPSKWKLNGEIETFNWD